MVFLLLTKFEEYRPQFDAGEKAHKSIWTMIGTDIKKMTGSHFSPSQLQSKLNSLKNRYKIILARKGKSGSGNIKWPYLERMEELFGHCAWANPKATADETGPSNIDLVEVPKAKKVKKPEIATMWEITRKEKQKRFNRKEEQRSRALQELKELKQKHH
nr:unnamed protein product [Callosobruchus analis]